MASLSASVMNFKMIIEKKKELSGHIAAVYALCESQGPYIYSGGADKHIVRWNLENPEDAAIIAKIPNSIYAIVEFTEHQLLFIGTSAGQIHVIDLNKKEEIKILKNHNGKVYDLLLHDNRLYSAGEDGCITITNIPELQTVQVLKAASSKIRSMDIKHHLLAFACGDGYLRQLNLIDLQPLKEIKAHEKAANVVKFHPYKNELISGGWDAHLKIWNEELALLKSIPAHNYAIYSIVFSPDHLYMATGSRDKSVKLWKTESIELPRTIDFEKLKGHQFSVNKLIWHKGVNLLVSAGDDKKIMIWEINKNA